MASCGSSCPYHWHDSDCEYCKARDNEIIDTKNYSYDTCPYYQKYAREHGGSQRPTSGSGGNIGCLPLIILFIFLFFMDSEVRSSLSHLFHNSKQTERSLEEVLDDSESNQSGFIFPNSAVELVSQEDIENLSDYDLSCAINEIYARHGYIFQNDEVRSYYKQFSWYIGEIPADEFSIDCFNQIEMQNWSLLTKERTNRNSSG